MADSYRQRLNTDFQQDFGSNLLLSVNDFHKGSLGSNGQATLSGSHGVKQKKKRLSRWIMAISVLLGVVLVGQFIYTVLIAPKLQVARVEINGLYGITQDQVMTATQIRSGMLITNVDVASIRTRVESLPRVSSATVEIRYPDTIQIDLVVRKPLGLVFHDGLLKGVDDHGAIFPVSRSEHKDLPIFTGFSLSSDSEGTAGLDKRYSRFITDIEQLRLEDPALFRLFSEFEFIDLQPGGFQVRVYPSHVQVRALIGDRFPRERAVYVLRMIQMVTDPDYGERVGEIDFRTDDMVYSRVGGQS